MTDGPTLPMYAQISSRLGDAIRTGLVPHGTILTESIIADHFEVSRQTARNALQALQANRQIRARVGKRGFTVAMQGGAPPLSAGGADNPLAGIEKLSPTIKWIERYDAIKFELLALASAGERRIVPSKLAECHDISRTVLRDIQVRLVEDNIMRLDGQKWVLNRFDARAISEQFQVRILLEQHALSEGFDRIDQGFLQDCIARLESASQQSTSLTSQRLERLEADLHDHLLSYCGNDFLMAVLRRSRLVHVFNSFYFPRYSSRHLFADEHIEVLAAVRAGNLQAAQSALVWHLENSSQKTQDRLERFKQENAGLDYPYTRPL